MTNLRSLLFVPGDSEKKLAKADATGADALLLDLEDSVADTRKPAARDMVAAFLADRTGGRRRPRLWVRINPLDTDHALADLVQIAAAAPDGIMLPKAGGPEDVARLSHYLDALEAQAGLAAGSIGIIPIATETADAPFRLGEYARAALPRLTGITWGGEDLATALGASSNRDATGQFAFTYQLVRSLTLMAGHAAGVQAIDSVHVDFRDEDGFRAACRASRAEGFTGRLAIHPAQVPIINQCYMPSPEEVAHARRIVDAMAKSDGAGAASLDGKMVDAPHLKQAERVLAEAAAYGENG